MAQWFELPQAPLRLTAHGQWLHGDEPLPAKLARFFGRYVRPAGAHDYRVVVGHESAPLAVGDVAYFVTSMALTVTAGELVGVTLQLSDGTEEALRPDTLMQSDAHVLYCRLLRHGFWVPCRFPPAQYHTLALHVDAGDNGYALRLGHKHYPIAPYEVGALLATGEAGAANVAGGAKQAGV